MKLLKKLLIALLCILSLGTIFAAADYSGQNLAGRVFNNMDLRGANFTSSNLRGAHFYGTQLEDANLTNADLRDAGLGGANLTRAQIAGVQWERAIFSRQTIWPEGFNHLSVGMVGPGVDFSNQNLGSRVFNNLDLMGANFTSSNLRGAHFYGTQLEDANLTNADLRDAGLGGANLTRAQIAGVQWERAIFSRQTIWPEGFNHLSVGMVGPGVDFSNQNLGSRVFNNLDLMGANFTSSNLRGAHFYGTQLENANLTNADLRDAGLGGANLTDAQIIGVQWQGAFFDRSTSFPSGFDPLFVGMIGPQVDFSNQNLAGRVFNNLDLMGANFTNSNLRTATFAGTQLANATLENADLRDVVLQDANLTNAILTNSNLSSCNLTRAKLEGADFSGSILVNVVGTGASFDGATKFPQGFDPISAGMIPSLPDYSNQNLSGRVFNNLDLVGANFTNSNLRGAHFYGSSLVDANLTNADLRGAGLGSANLTGAQIPGVQWEGALFDRQTRWPSGFDPLSVGMFGPWVDFSNQNLSGRIFNNLDLMGANFTSSNLRGTHFYGSSLVDANLTNADLRDAGLGGANLTDAQIVGVQWQGAFFDRSTRWPSGFNPLSVGMIGPGVDFSFPSLAGRVFNNLDLMSANFTNSNLRGTHFYGSSLVDANLTNADLRGAGLGGANLNGAQIVYVQWEGAFFDRHTKWPSGFNPLSAGMIGPGVDFSNQNLSGKVFNNLDLMGANFTNSNLRGTHLYGTQLTDANLTNADLRNAGLGGANLTRAQIAGVQWEGALFDRHTRWPLGFDPLSAEMLGPWIDFSKQNLSGKVFNNLDLMGANFTNSNLQNSHFAGTRMEGVVLSGANLSNAYLSGANLSGAFYTANTIWPFGFDPIAEGAIFIEQEDSDSDGDGVNDYREAHDGTNPGDPNSFKALSKGLVAFYRFENNLSDESGHARHLTDQFNAGFSSSFSDSGFALQTTSSNGAVTLKKSGIVGNHPRTFSAWIKSEGPQPWPQGYFLGLGYGGTDGGSASTLSLDSSTFNDPILHMDNNYANVYSIQLPQFHGGWKHVAVTYQGKLSNAKMYVNGKEVPTVLPEGYSNPDGTLNTADGGIIVSGFIGANDHDGPQGRGFTGLMDNLRIYDRALTMSEIIQLYNTEDPNLPTPEMVTISLDEPVSLGLPDFLPTTSVLLPAFTIAKFETTYALWDAVVKRAQRQLGWKLTPGVMGSGAGQTNPDHPVTNITLHDIALWCNAFSIVSGLNPVYATTDPSGNIETITPENQHYAVAHGIIWNWNANGYRLPTGNEWEVAARGGLQNARYPWGDEPPNPSNCNWVVANGYPNNTTPVGAYPLNGYGLADCAGGIWEFTWDNALEPSNSMPYKISVYSATRGGAWNAGWDPRISASYGGLITLLDARGEIGFRLAKGALVLDSNGDEDGDGLNNAVETNTGAFVSATDTGTNPLVADTNSDGFRDGEAVGAGLNPLTNYAGAISLVKQLSAVTPGRFDLYTSDAIMDLNLGALTIQKNGQTVTLELQLQSTTDLATQPFTNLGAPVEFQMEMPSNKGFLRVHALGSQ